MRSVCHWEGVVQCLGERPADVSEHVWTGLVALNGSVSVTDCQQQELDLKIRSDQIR